MAYQRKLIRQFLRAVYLFDDHIKIIFDFAEDTDSGVEIPIDESGGDGGEVKDVLIRGNMGSHIILIRTPASLRMVGRVFVL